MKKYLLVSLTVLFAAAFLWADDAVVQLPEPKVDIEGKGTVEWGIDFGKKTGSAKDRGVQHGFKNSASWKVKFPLIKKGDIKSSKADVPVYGEVILKDVELNIQSVHDKDDKKFVFDGKVDKLEAKFVFYGAYLTVHGAPSFKTNFADLWKPLKEDDFDNDKDHGFKFEPGFDGAGFKLGYANKNLMDLDLGLKFGSNGAWDAKEKKSDSSYTGKFKIVTLTEAAYPVNHPQAVKVGKEEVWVSTATGLEYFAGAHITIPGRYDIFNDKPKSDAIHSKYGIGFDFSMKPLDKMLGIAFKVNSTFGTAKKHGSDEGYRNGIGNHLGDKVVVNFGTEITSEPVNALKFKLGFDGGYAFEGKYDDQGKRPASFAWDLLFNTEYKWVSGGVYVASVGTPYQGRNAQATEASKVLTADMAVYLKFETKGSKKDDGKLEDSYLVEGLDAGVYLGMFRLLSKAPKNAKTQVPMVMKFWGSYKANLGDSMWIKPFATIWGETNHWADPTSLTGATKKPYVGVAYDLGVTYSPVEKVEITAKWAHGKLTNNVYAAGVNQNRDDEMSMIKQAANHYNHNGTFTLGVTVKY